MQPCTVWIYSSPACSAAADTGALPATMLTFEMGEEESHRKKLVEGGPATIFLEPGRTSACRVLRRRRREGKGARGCGEVVAVRPGRPGG
jgi:hypothetical protein